MLLTLTPHGVIITADFLTETELGKDWSYGPTTYNTACKSYGPRGK